ncbi:hypothetical protein COXBURSA331_A0215 [Coxiella burnetii RSA 331]|nr:hypothetical protein COXBURSA331_A0215 [Coxiella burnetii RSA 331]EDR36533.1 hypothetical protein COXBURSA334_1957 [Coxiella burnetii Q321]
MHGSPLEAPSLLSLAQAPEIYFFKYFLTRLSENWTCFFTIT